MSHSGGAAGERLYRLLLRLYPQAFRIRFEELMVEAFREQRRDGVYALRGGALRFWLEVSWDLLRSLPVARRREVRAIRTERPRRPPGRRRLEVLVYGLIQDFKYAVRTLLRSPGVTAMAVLTLSVGIAANAAIFGVVNSVLLQPLPYGEPERVVTIWSKWVGFPKTWVSNPEYRAYLSHSHSFEDLAIWFETEVNFTDPQNPQRVRAVGATENLVDILKVRMSAGRFFTAEESLRFNTVPTDIVVISHRTWQNRFAGSSQLVGRKVEVNGRSLEVIGVLPEGFRLPTEFSGAQTADLYFPLYVPRTPVEAYPTSGGSHGSFVVGRLKPGATVESAQNDVRAVIDRMRSEKQAYPATMGFEPLLFSAADDVLGSVRPALMALLGTVAFVLLIACANVANLLLFRSQSRQGEMAVRSVLGAGRLRIVRQILSESLVLAAVGGGLGLLLAYGGVELIKALNPGNLPRIETVSVSNPVILFCGVIIVLTAILSGILPALRAMSVDLSSRLDKRGVRGLGRAGWQSALVSSEVALAVVLVMGAGLMIRTFGELSAIDVGFKGENLLTMAVSLPTSTYPTAQDALVFHREAIRKFEEIPGVSKATAARILPLASQIGDWGVRIENYVAPQGLRQNADWQFAAPGYFETMGIPLVRGRTIEEGDDENGAGAVVVNEAFVRHFFPDGEDPLGRRMRMGGSRSQNPFMTIVGVVGNVTHNGLTAEIKRKFYIPLAQWNMASRGRPTSLRYVIQTEGPAIAAAGPARSVIRRLDPSLAIAELQTMDDIVSSAVAQPRFTVVLMGMFSAVAVILAMIGIYGVISYGVSQRRHEIGIRMALGAERQSVVGLMLRSGLLMIGVGLGVGMVAALLMTRFLGSLLYNVSPQDPPTFLMVGVGLAVVGWLATYIPSRRAASVDPMRVLRSE